ncbi:MAG: iron-sulfur cluster assembly scaffold protein [Dehalococcoidales bacterium]|jgi:nitrogen fixation NifU-like protein|nr:iron-sulfur cluster assembly scaffold protein [Dehalococcoidales bacterium]
MVLERQEHEDLIESKMREAYSEEVVDHALHPRNLGDMKDADAFGRITGPCGDTMEIWLKVSGDKVTAASFATDGCAATISTGSMVTEMVKGKTVGEVLGISQQDILDALNGLPEGNRHCALLAANTLKKAAKDYLAFRKEPWKRAYRKY